MKDEVLFVENQSFLRLWWLVLLLVTILFTRVMELFWRVTEDGDVLRLIDYFNTIALLLCIIFIFVFLFSKMRTVITPEGIYVKYLYVLRIPSKTRFFAWENIKDAQIQKFSALSPYFFGLLSIAVVVLAITDGGTLSKILLIMTLPVSVVLLINKSRKKRISQFGNHLHVSGNIHLQLTFKNEEQIFIGTKNAVELEEVLNKLKKQQNERRNFIH